MFLILGRDSFEDARISIKILDKKGKTAPLVICPGETLIYKVKARFFK